MTLTFKTCKKGHENPPQARFCRVCGNTLDIKTPIEVKEKLEDMRNSIAITEKILTQLETYAAIQNQYAEKIKTLEKGLKSKSD